RATRLRVSHAFHSPLMEPMLAEFAEAVSALGYRRPVLPAVSTVTGRALGEQDDPHSPDWTSPDYWVRQVREAVRFHDAVRTATDRLGVTRFLEVGPDPVLAGLVQSTAPDTHAVATLREGRDEPACVLSALAEMFVRGATADWAAMFAGTGARRTDLPTYAFQRRRYWLDATRTATDARGLGLGVAGHPLLGAAVAVAGSDTLLLTARLSAGSVPWLTDHVVGDLLVVPGTALVELAVQAGLRADCDRLDELTLQAPLILPDQGAVQVQIVLDTADGDRSSRTVRIFSRAEDAEIEQAWTLHATGAVSRTTPAAESWDLRVWPPAEAEPVDVTGLYERLTDAGLRYGPAFRGIDRVWRAGDEWFVEAALPEPVADDAAAFGLHPALLDTLLHTLALRGGEGRGALLPFVWSGVTLPAVGASTVRARLRMRGDDEVGLWVADAAGDPVAAVDSLLLRPVAPAELAAQRTPADTENLYRVEWTPASAARPDQDRAARREPHGIAVLGGPTTTTPGIPGLDPTHPDLDALIAALDEGQDIPHRVLLPVPAGPVADTVPAVLTAVQRWLGEERFSAARLVVVTSG
ncbi:polyketide synthase dehydratase domain-containing protein, partial [Streptomyces glaucus]|uniref:polyketide synthase dehydratase domain-containing protein n=1 Tax=Streptomyces glaucus TaxID=284029 RepID=UPI0031DA1206